MKNTDTTSSSTTTLAELTRMSKQIRAIFEIECDLEFNARQGDDADVIRLQAGVTDSLYQALCGISHAQSSMIDLAARKRDDAGMERLADNAMVDYDPRSDIDWMANGAD